MRRNFKKELKKYCEILIHVKIDREEKLKLLDEITMLMSGEKTEQTLDRINKLQAYIDLLGYNYLIDELDEKYDWVTINGADTLQGICDILDELVYTGKDYRILERIKEQTVVFQFICGEYQLNLLKNDYLEDGKQKYYAKYYKGTNKC